MTQKTKVIGFFNRKGGVGKSTSAANFAAGLARYGRRVLLVDCDAQGSQADFFNVTFAMGLDMPLLRPRQFKIAEIVHPVRENLDLVPADDALDDVSYALQNRDDTTALARLLRTIKGYEVIVLDTPPGRNYMYKLAMRAATHVIIPVRANYLDMRGIDKALDTVEDALMRGDEIVVSGILPVMVDMRTRNDSEMMRLLRGTFASAHTPPLLPEIRISTAVASSPGFGQTIWEYENSPSAQRGQEDYDKLVRMFLRR